MRILWHSNAPWAATGYANQTKLFTNRIRDLGHDVAISAFYGLEGASIEYDGMTVYPKGYDGFGGDVLPGHYGHFGADIAISLIDAWVFHPEQWPPQIRWIPWFPVDMEPLPPAVARPVAQAWDRIVYSKFALEQVHNAGLQAHYVPHGIDTQAFAPMDQQEARAKLQMPPDTFVVGIIGANKGYPPRKAWPEMIQAFSEFKRKHGDAILYAHTNPGTQNGGVNMLELFEAYGLVPGRDVAWPNMYRNMIGGYDNADMRAFYSAFDVHLLASSGEGFGIPIVESQACGCPVIVGDWTSMPELCFSGWKLPKEEAYPMYTPMGSYQFYPRVGAIVDALEQAYAAKGDESVRTLAREGALEYDADKVTERYWKPVLERIAERIAG